MTHCLSLLTDRVKTCRLLLAHIDNHVFRTNFYTGLSEPILIPFIFLTSSQFRFLSQSLLRISQPNKKSPKTSSLVCAVNETDMEEKTMGEHKAEYCMLYENQHADK